MRPALCGVKGRTGRGEQTCADTTKPGGWKGLRRRDGPGGLGRAPSPDAPFLAHERRAPAGRAGNRDSFPAAPSPRLLPGRPEAAPHSTAAIPQAPPPRSRGPPDGGSARGTLTVKVRREPRPTGPRPLGLPGSSVRVWHHRPRSHRRAPGIPTPRQEQRRLRRDAGERAGGGSGVEGCPLIPGAGKRWASNLGL